MGVPPRSGRSSSSSPGERAAKGPWKLPPLVVALGGAALLVLLVGGLVLGFLLFRGAPGSTQEVVGSDLPPVWQPGNDRGVGQTPPLPPGSTLPRPAGTPPPVVEVQPYPPEAPEPAEGEPMTDGESGPLPEGEPPQAPPEAPVAPSFQPPRLLYLPTPEYPPVGLRMRREGVVNLQVLVSAEGRVLEAEPVGARLGMGFEASARRAAFAARFEPARRNGEPVEGEGRIAIRFRLQ
jgi:TonB family protein